MGTQLNQNTGFKVNAGPYTYNGGLYTWGFGGDGGLGDGTTTDKNTPQKIGSLSTWSKIDYGYKSFVALKTDGTIWTCGYGDYGNLGNGTTIDYSSPIQVGSLNTWSKISHKNAHAAAIKTDGTLWTWGYNGSGQLGNNTSGSPANYNAYNYSSPDRKSTRLNPVTLESRMPSSA